MLASLVTKPTVETRARLRASLNLPRLPNCPPLRRTGDLARIALDTLHYFHAAPLRRSRFRGRAPSGAGSEQIADPIVLSQCRALAVWVINFPVYLATQADCGATASTLSLSSGLGFSFTYPGFA
jgi:hypothetical protein